MPDYVWAEVCCATHSTVLVMIDAFCRLPTIWNSSKSNYLTRNHTREICVFTSRGKDDILHTPPKDYCKRILYHLSRFWITHPTIDRCWLCIDVVFHDLCTVADKAGATQRWIFNQTRSAVFQGSFLSPWKARRSHWQHYLWYRVFCVTVLWMGSSPINGLFTCMVACKLLHKSLSNMAFETWVRWVFSFRFK